MSATGWALCLIWAVVWTGLVLRWNRPANHNTPKLGPPQPSDEDDLEDELEAIFMWDLFFDD